MITSHIASYSTSSAGIVLGTSGAQQRNLYSPFVISVGASNVEPASWVFTILSSPLFKINVAVYVAGFSPTIIFKSCLAENAVPDNLITTSSSVILISVVYESLPSIQFIVVTGWLILNNSTSVEPTLCVTLIGYIFPLYSFTSIVVYPPTDCSFPIWLAISLNALSRSVCLAAE